MNASESLNLQNCKLNEKFDWEFYTQFYEDLDGLYDYKTAYAHWSKYGIYEDRHGSLVSLCKEKLGTDLSELPENFNFEEYIQLNPDIQDFCDNNRYKATWHYIAYGRHEKRKYTSRLDDSKLEQENSPQAIILSHWETSKNDSKEPELSSTTKPLVLADSKINNIGIEPQDKSATTRIVLPIQKDLETPPSSRDESIQKSKAFVKNESDQKKSKGETATTLVALQDPNKEATSHKNKKRQGRIDFYKNGLVRGWALPDGHTGFAELSVYIDQVFVKTILANTSRQDLLKHNLGHGRNGFELEVPDFWMKKQVQSLDIRFSDSDTAVRNSPVEISLTEATFNRQKDKAFEKVANVHKILAFHRKSRIITIVIPVFNAYEEVRECIQSVIEHTSMEANMLLLNDCSTDERITDLFKWASTHPNIKAIHNSENLGYTATINRGIDIAKNDDIVLLNSDTRVGPQWLQNLQRAAYHDVDIATATAISDNAGAFSVPEIGKLNKMPIWLTDAEMNRVVSQNSYRLYPEVPTGSGFCIYIRRDFLNVIGNFDEEAFPRGYGEENDFCMRAVRAGWRNIIDDSTLVYHVRSASFKEEKQSLIIKGREVVDKRYPEYKALTPIYRQSQELQYVRYNIRRLIEGVGEIQKRVLPRVLYVISTRTGGTPQTNEDLMAGMKDRYHTFLLLCDRQTISLYDASCNPHKLCECVRLAIPISVTTHCSSEYEKVVASMLIKYSIELLHIRHIAWHSLTLPKVAKQLNIPVIFSLHDFYTICPTVNLLDENKVFCGGSCTNSSGECSAALWPGVPSLKHNFISTWQRMMAEMMEFVDAFVTTAQSAKDQLCTVYPQLENTNFAVIPHGRDFLQMKKGKTLPEQVFRPSQPLKILFPGNISVHKGAEIISELHKSDIEKRLEIHFLGTTAPILKSVGHHHGAYERSHFFDLIQKISPHYVGIFSIWPETYCHTLTESWASGVPVIALDHGAVGERIRAHKGGWLIDSHDVETIYEKLLRISEDGAGYSQKMSEVKQWQQSYGIQNNISTMAARYHDLYQQVLSNMRSFTLHGSKKKRIKLGVFVRIDDYGESTPSTHVRVLDWLNHYDVSKRIDAQFLDVDTFLQDDSRLLDLEVVLIQRNIIKPHLVNKFIQSCNQRHLPIIFEIDDDLMGVPVEKDPDGHYARTADSIKNIVRSAAKVIVSTQPLAEKMKAYSNNVLVIPNALPEFLWLRPEEKVAQGAENNFEKNTKQNNILYMGNPTHSEDLALLRPVFERFYEEKKPIKLFVIGGEHVGNQQKKWYERIDIPQEYRHYPNFVKWLKSLSGHFDMAVAPLTQTSFNKSKSSLKYIQYSAMGLPAIYSNCLPYSEVVEDRINGFLVENDKESWYKLLVSCLNKKGDLSKIGEAAKKNVLEKHLMSMYTNTYASVFESVTLTSN